MSGEADDPKPVCSNCEKLDRILGVANEHSARDAQRISELSRMVLLAENDAYGARQRLHAFEAAMDDVCDDLLAITNAEARVDPQEYAKHALKRIKRLEEES